MLDPFGLQEGEPRTPATDPRAYDADIAAVVAGLVASGEPLGKISVIKGLRDRRSVGLKDAKDAVEEYGRRHGVEALVRPEVIGAGCLFALAGLALVSLGAFLLWRTIVPA